MQKKLLRQLWIGVALAGLCLLVFGTSAFAQSDPTADKTVVSDTLLIDTAITGTIQSEPGVLIIAVENLLDMGRSATNVVGNAVASTLVAKWEGELRPMGSPENPPEGVPVSSPQRSEQG